MKIKSNISKILKEKNISIRQLHIKMNRDYANTYRLCTDEYIGKKKFENIVRLARCLDVEIEDLFSIEE